MKEQILEACFELFARRGVRAAGVDDLVANAGVAMATFYSCVHSKEEVALAYLQYLYLVWAGAFDAAVARGPGPESLLGLFDALEGLCGDDGTRCASFVHVLAEVGPDAPLGRASIEHSARLRAHIAVLAEAAGLREPAEFAAACQLLLQGSIVACSQGSLRPLENARTLARVLIEHHLEPEGQALQAQ